jgi:tetratricopeptide (TPR) repeat protein
MSEAAPRSDYDLFISYAHADDGDGWVAAFIEALQSEHAKYTPTPLAIFFDDNEIRTMDDWEHRIYRGLRHAKVMITVLSPNYFNSPYCRKEWERYTDLEIARALPGEGIAPIYAITVAGFEIEADEKLDRWSANLRRRQFLDLRKCRDEGPGAFRHSDVQRRIEALDQRIHARLEKAERAASSPTTIPPHNEHFVGRQNEMRRLRESLALGRVGVITAVHGIGGIGKSALAFEYAHAFADDYPGGRYLVPCAGVDDVRIPILNLAEPKGITLADNEKKNLDAAFARVRAAFERGPRLLLLFDAVDDPALLAPHRVAYSLPSSESIHVLVTTRLGPDRLPGLECLPLDSLPEPDALRLLETYRSFKNDDERTSALWIVQRLEGHPLAVEVVAVYLWQTPDVSYVGFADRLRSEGLGAVTGAASDDAVALSRNPVKFLPSLLEPTLARLSPPERLALQFAALIPHSRIAIPWLRTLVSQQFPDVNSDTKPGYPDAWELVLRRLRGLRLLLQGDSKHLDRMHGLVQEVVGSRLAPDEATERWTALVTHIFSRAESLRNASQTRFGLWELEPLRDYSLLLLEGKHLEGGIVLGLKTTGALASVGRFAEARALLRYAVSKLESGQVGNRRVVAACYGNVAAVEFHMGNFVEAKRLFLRAIEVDKEVEKTNDEELAIHYSGLGLVEQKLGNLAEAKRLLQQDLVTAERAGGTHQRRLATCCSNLATVEADSGDLPEAGRLVRRAIEIREQDDEPDRATLATLYSNLSSIEQDLGNHLDAKSLAIRAIENAKQVYDPDHHVFVPMYGNLGMSELKLGNPVRAKQLIIQSIEIVKRVFGSEHHELATQLSNLATAEESLGNRDQIRPLMQQVHEIRVSQLGSDHPLTRSAADWLTADDRAKTLASQGGTNAPSEEPPRTADADVLKTLNR